MKTFLLNDLKKIGLLFFAILTISLTNAQSGSSNDEEDIQEIPELVFRNATLISGTSGKEGAVYLFKDVTTGFDATIKLKKFSDPAIYMKSFDNTSFGWDKAFQPEFGMNTVKPYQNWYIDFEMTFLEAGTNTKKKADRFTVTSLDVDGDGVNVKEYAVMEKASSVTYSTVSYLLNGSTSIPVLPTCCDCQKQSAVTGCGDCAGTGQVKTKSGSGGKVRTKKCGKCDGVGKIYLVCQHSYCGEDASVQGPTDNFTNIDTAATSVMATYVYNNKETVNFRIGAVSGNRTGGAGVRLNSLWFRAFSLAPAVTLPVRLSNFSALYDKTAVTLNWKTELEQNFSHFVVERSEDGKTFTDATVVFSITDADGYAYKDKNTTSATGVIYYRLRSVDKTGEANYSAIRIIKLSKEEAQGLELSAYPNPVVNQVRLTIPANWQGKKVNMEIVSSTGARVQTMQFTNASQTETVPMQTLGKGFYVVKASCDNETAHQHLIKN